VQPRPHRDVESSGQELGAEEEASPKVAPRHAVRQISLTAAAAAGACARSSCFWCCEFTSLGFHASPVQCEAEEAALLKAARRRLQPAAFIVSRPAAAPKNLLLMHRCLCPGTGDAGVLCGAQPPGGRRPPVRSRRLCGRGRPVLADRRRHQPAGHLQVRLCLRMIYSVPEQADTSVSELSA